MAATTRLQARILLAGVAAVIVGWSGLAQAADFEKEVSTATAHAVMAAEAATVAMVHAHMQHVVNCLVGPEGKGYDAKAANPCQALGKGAIPDVLDLEDPRLPKLRIAVAKAMEGLKNDDLAGVKKDATALVAALK